MGLDWNPIGKPKSGAEEEFASLFQQLGELPVKPGLFERFRKRWHGIDREALKSRWEEIQITPYETVGAPQVGASAEADTWARQRYNEMPAPRPTEEEFWQNMRGYYVLQLAPPCDGFPYYSNWTAGYVERFSFRAQFLLDCEDIIDEHTLEKCYLSCLAPGLVTLGQELRACVTSYAQPRNLEQIEFADADNFQLGSPESNTHILYQPRAGVSIGRVAATDSRLIGRNESVECESEAQTRCRR